MSLEFTVGSESRITHASVSLLVVPVDSAGSGWMPVTLQDPFVYQEVWLLKFCFSICLIPIVDTHHHWDINGQSHKQYKVFLSLLYLVVLFSFWNFAVSPVTGPVVPWMDKATTTNSSIFLGRLILNSGTSWMVFLQEVVLHKWIWQGKWWLPLLGERTSIGLRLGLYCWFSLELTFCSLRRGSGIFQTPADGCLALIHSGASTVLTEKMEK